MENIAGIFKLPLDYTLRNKDTAKRTFFLNLGPRFHSQAFKPFQINTDGGGGNG